MILPIISIHAPREGGDFIGSDAERAEIEFQSTPPARGATEWSENGAFDDGIFQSTPPARGATDKTSFSIAYTDISIHAPREGGDKSKTSAKMRYINFNPRPPRGGRLAIMSVIRCLDAFQSTPPARGATWC